MRRLGQTSFLLMALLACTGPALAFEGSGFPLPAGWISVPLILSAATASFLLRNAQGRRFLGRTVLGVLVLIPTAMWLVTEGRIAMLIGAALILFSPWLILLALVVGVWRNNDPLKRVALPEPGEFPDTRPLDQA